MTDYSLRVSNQLKTGSHVASALTTNAKQLAQQLAPRFPEFSLSTLEKMVLAFASRLTEANDKLRHAEQAYFAEQSDDPSFRKIRDEKHAQAIDVWDFVVARISNAEGPDSPRHYGLREAKPSTPDQLADLMLASAARLRESSAPFVDRLGMATAPNALADLLQQAAQELHTALEHVRRESRELQHALIQRDEAVDAWRQTYQAIAQFAEALFRLADSLRMAEYVRPTQRRNFGTEVSPEPPNPQTNNIDLPS